MNIMKSIFVMGLAAVCLLAEDNYPRLVAEWDFSKADVLTAGPFPGKLRKGAVIEDGLLISRQTQPEQQGGMQLVKRFPELDMKNAFRVEAVFQVDNVKAVQRKMIFDSKYSYVSPKSGHFGGFMLALETLGEDRYRAYASFGYGAEASTVIGKPVMLKQGELHILQMNYSALGDVTFVIDDVADAGGGKVKFGAIAKAEFPAIIGDRVGSTYCPFGKGLAKLSIYEEKPVYFGVFADSEFRRVFERGEANPVLHYCLLNNTGAVVEGYQVVIGEEQSPLGSITNGETVRQAIETMANGAIVKKEIKLDNTLLPGRYTLKMRVLDRDGKEIQDGELSYTIVPAYREHLALALTGSADLEKVRKSGFTHVRYVGSLVSSRKPVGESYKATIIERLDKVLDAGLYQNFYVRPVSYFGKLPEDEKYLRRDRRGNIYANKPLDVNNPELIKEICELTESWAKALGDHPAWDLVTINSEVRDSMQPAFGGAEEENFKKFAGYPVPAEVNTKYPESYKGNSNFPWDRVLPENDKLLTYYRWLWGNGDGWNNIHSLISDIVHKHLPHHHTTFYEPAVRNPPRWGSGGRVDTISQWSYTNPDPIKINQAFDELRAMADEHEHQEIFKETQIIWYRNQTAPIGEKVPNEPEWTSREPDAQYITIPPDCLREALWCDVSHRVQCLLFHGSQCLYGNSPGSTYKFTNADTVKVFEEMAYSVLKPLGSVIRLVPERLPEVAILESFTASIYAPGHATSGWSKGWTADLHLALQWAHIQPSVIYEEHLLTGKKMENVKVILLPWAEVLGEDVLKKLQEYQRRGVILVGDEFMLPALMPDVRIHSVARTANPQENKAKLQALGAELAALLKGHYDSPIGASDPDIIVRRRGTEAADYVFIANDKREFGDYLGPWKRVMEKGVPVSGTVTVGHGVKAAYDLVRHAPVAFRQEGNGVSFDVSLGPADGRMFLLLQQRIGGVRVQVPAKPVMRGQEFRIDCEIVDDRGQRVAADLPVEVTLLGADQDIIYNVPGAGYYAAKGGQLTITDVAPSNMTPGKVNVEVRDLASGLSCTTSFKVR